MRFCPFVRSLVVVPCLAALLSGAAAAQDSYPTRPITLIVPFAAGGSTDVIARVVAEAMRGVLGQSLVVDNLPTSLPLIEAGKLRALAVSSPQRLAVLPEVPTFAELGLSDLDWMAFFGLIAPAKTPQAVIERLNAALAQALASPAVRDTLAKQQAQPQPGRPDDFAALIARELARMKRAVAAAKIEVN